MAAQVAEKFSESLREIVKETNTNWGERRRLNNFPDNGQPLLIDMTMQVQSREFGEQQDLEAQGFRQQMENTFGHEARHIK